MHRLAERVKAFRTFLGLSQVELAKKAHIGQTTLSRIENGEDCKISVIQKIENALGRKLY